VGYTDAMVRRLESDRVDVPEIFQEALGRARELGHVMAGQAWDSNLARSQCLHCGARVAVVFRGDLGLIWAAGPSTSCTRPADKA
jgi:hypothetical protein